MMTTFSLCTTCGVEHIHPLPAVCAICADERQFLPTDGVQRWTTLDALQRERSMRVWEMESGLFGITTSPAVGIGHRPILLQTPEGNLLWDPPAYIDDDGIEQVRSLGGVRWIAPSHPHMFGAQLEWSAAFDNAPVLVNRYDQQWLARRGSAIDLWDDDLRLTGELALMRVGGHFPGMAMAHWRGADGAGVLLSGDAIVPVPAAGWATFMRSYPNHIPLSPKAVQHIADRVRDLTFERVYANFEERICLTGGKAMVERSARRHIGWMTGEFDHLT